MSESNSNHRRHSSRRKRRRSSRSKQFFTPARLVGVIALLLGLGGIVAADWWLSGSSSGGGGPQDPTAYPTPRQSPTPFRIVLPTSSIPTVPPLPTATPIPVMVPTIPTAPPLPPTPTAAAVLPPQTVPSAAGPSPLAQPQPGTQVTDNKRDFAYSFPADVLLLFQGNPCAQGLQDQSARLTDMIRMLLPLGQMASPQIKAFLDLLAPLPTLSQREHAFAVLNVQLERLNANLVKVNRLEMALLIRTHGDNREVLQRLQAVIASYVKPEDAAIKNFERPHAKYNSQRLIHSKLPEWAIVEWGQVDDCYLITAGEGVFDRILAVRAGQSEALAAQPWYLRSQVALKGPSSFLSLYVQLERTRKQLDAALAGIPGKMVHSLQLESAKEVRWAMGLEGRFIRSLLWISDGNPAADRVVVLSDPAAPPPEVAAAIPPAATIVSVSKFDMPLQLTKIGQAWMNAMDPWMQNELREVWERLGEKVGGNLYDALVARTGPYLVIHNYPPHDLGWSLMFTILLQYDGAATVKPGMDAVMTQLQRELAAVAEKNHGTFNLRLVRDPDGIWSLPLILFTPAIGVSDRWLVISWSPQAVRANMIFLSKQNGTIPATNP